MTKIIWKLSPLFLFAAVGLTACSSSQPKQEPRDTSATDKTLSAQQPQAANESPELGVIRNQAGQADIPTRKTIIGQQEIPTVTQSRTGADINKMSVSDFVALGLPQSQAEEVVQRRSESGSFKSVNDLASIPDLDSRWLDQNKNRLAVGQLPTS